MEWSNRWKATPWLTFDANLARNHARFTGSAAQGKHVPSGPDVVDRVGLAVQQYGPWSGALFARYVGSYPLIEDDIVRSKAQTVFINAQVGYQLAPALRVRLGVFNPINQQTNDITYYYDSRLQGEPRILRAQVDSTRAQPSPLHKSFDPA